QPGGNHAGFSGFQYRKIWLSGITGTAAILQDCCVYLTSPTHHNLKIMKTIEFGLMTFADMAPETDPRKGVHAHQRIQELLEEIKCADELGIDVFGVGEHHRPDYAVSAPTTVLGAAAAITKNIKLSTAVTVLSSEDPVRVYQQFATVDAISGGRAEIMAGRG